MSLIDLFTGQIFKQKKKSENRKRVEDLATEPEPKTVKVEEAKKDAEKQRDDQPRPSKPLTRYTDDECLAMIKNGVVAIDAPQWVRDQVDRIRIKKLSEARPPEEEMREWMRSKGASNVGR